MIEAQYNPFLGKRLQFRHILPSDLELIRFWFNTPSVRGKIHLDDEINPWLAITEEQMKALYEKWTKKERRTHLMIETNDQQTPIGLVSWDIEWDSHCPSMDLFIAPDHARNDDFWLESLQLLLNYLYNYSPAHSVSWWISELDSERLAFAQKLGFQDQGKMRRIAIVEGRDVGLLVLDMLKREWIERQKQGN
ncbi:MAG: GNAT family N-acetyltransferase [Candidatus Thorarchaeota archaeon]